MKIMVAKIVEIKNKKGVKKISGKLIGIVKTVAVCNGKVEFSFEPVAPHLFNDGKEKYPLIVDDGQMLGGTIANLVVSDKENELVFSVSKNINPEFLLSLRQNRTKVTIYLRKGNVTKLTLE